LELLPNLGAECKRIENRTSLCDERPRSAFILLGPSFARKT
jgi:hypothetical protein